MKKVRIFVFLQWVTLLLLIFLGDWITFRAVWTSSKAFYFYLQLSDCIPSNYRAVSWKGNCDSY